MSRVVCDASALVAMLVDAGPAGEWATAALTGADLAAPHLVQFEVANVLRRHELTAVIGRDQAFQAATDLLDLAIELWPFEPLAARAWQLRPVLSIYDASYVALAELASAPLVTLDRRLEAAPGIHCAIARPD